MKTKIMFVDDEPNVLSGLRRMLRGQRKVWDTTFVGGGEAALELLEKEPFDVLVSDMRMPGIDGAKLLSTVAERYPNMVRLVLSGQSEYEKIFRAIGPAHQFMSKPCSPDILIETIDRACGVTGHLQDEYLRALTTQLDVLPSLPKVYQALVAEIESDEACMQRVADAIGSDLGMTAKVLQLVNSSFFGLPLHVTSPSHAVSLLGLNIIRPLVLTAQVFGQFEDPNIKGFSLDELVEHSLAVATCARSIAEQQTADANTIDDSFIAGMMHDIGKLVLAANLPQRFSEAIRLSRHLKLSLADAEKLVFGCTHAQIGAHLLGLWGLPNPIVEAIAFHHEPELSSVTNFSPLAAVHIADAVQQRNFPGDGASSTHELDEAFLNRIGLSTEIESWEEVAHAVFAHRD